MKNLDFLNTSLIAHRGFFDNEKGIPENSMLAFQRAIQNHYNIELDVHILKDGKIVVFHDDHLKRMTNLDTAIKDCTYDDVKNLNLLNTNEKIPLLQEVLDFVAGKVTILIELKYDTKVGLLEKELVKILQNYKGQYAVQSFRPRSIWWFRKNEPEIVRGQLSCGFEKSKMSYLQRYFMANMLFNHFTKPDFISYDVHSIDKILPKIPKNTKILAWPIREKQTFEKYVKICDNLICENFNFLVPKAWKKNKNSI